MGKLSLDQSRNRVARRRCLTREVAQNPRLLEDTEQRIIQQVPEKNEMIEHIRVVTEGSLEAQVRETATHVAQEISNSVATETVENLLDQQMAHQSLAQQPSSSPWGWIAGLAVVAAAGAAAYFFYLS